VEDEVEVGGGSFVMVDRQNFWEMLKNRNQWRQV
jgi:hypothetical protein